MNLIQLLFDHGYVVGLRCIQTKPSGLEERMAEWDGKYIVFDPNDDFEGFCLVGNDLDKLVQDSVDHLELLEQV